MGLSCRYPLVISSLVLAMQSSAWADCTGEMEAYKAAKDSFSAEVSDIYNISVPDIEFDYQEREFFSLYQLERTSELSVLAEISSSGAILHGELDGMFKALTTSASSIFLKRRPLPSAFVKGAGLSRCYASLEQAEVERIRSSASDQPGDVIVSDEETTERVPNAEMAAKAAERRSRSEGLIEESNRTDDPEEANDLAIAGRVGLAMADISDELAVMTENPEIIEGVAQEIATRFSTNLPMVMMMGGRAHERKALQENIRNSLGRELDFGNWISLKESQ